MRSVLESFLSGAFRDTSQPSRRWSMSTISRSETPSAFGQQFGLGVEALIDQALLLLLEFEEELALPLRGADLHQPPVVHDELQDVRLDPEGRVIGELDVLVGVELLDRLHEPDVAFLDEVEQVLHPHALELKGDLDHQPQIRGHQDVGRVLVPLLHNADAVVALFLACQQPVFTDFGKVAMQRVELDQSLLIVIFLGSGCLGHLGGGRLGRFLRNPLGAVLFIAWGRLGLGRGFFGEGGCRGRLFGFPSVLTG